MRRQRGEGGDPQRRHRRPSREAAAARRAGVRGRHAGIAIDWNDLIAPVKTYHNRPSPDENLRYHRRLAALAVRLTCHAQCRPPTRRPPRPASEMKIIQTVLLIDVGGFSKTAQWKTIEKQIHAAIKSIQWPPQSGSFTLYPQSGKKRGEGNGVKPIKDACIVHLVERHNWK